MAFCIKDNITSNLLSDIALTHIKTIEYVKTITIICEVAKEIDYDCVMLWSQADGVSQLDTVECLGRVKRSIDASFSLLYDRFDQQGQEKKELLILQDIHRIYDGEDAYKLQAMIERHLKGRYSLNIIGISPSGVIPYEIERFIQIEEMPLPNQEQLSGAISAHLETFNIRLSRSVNAKLASTLSGLVEDEALMLVNRIVTTAMQQKLPINEEILSIAYDQKKQVIQKSGVLEFVTPNVGIDDVGGLYNLKSWLRNNKTIFDDPVEAKRNGIKPPRGILLFGMPGSGKSLTAKVTANYFNLPLLRVDMGLIYGQKSPEEAVGRLCSVSDSIAPCVLWIDEVEKALAGSENSAGNDVAIKILGLLLTWMQERTAPVFIVLTANDISAIRPEFYRDGRIDEKFMVMFLDDTPQIKNVIDIHLRMRLKEQVDEIVRPLDYDAIRRKMEMRVVSVGGKDSESGKNLAGYTGANIEALVEKTLKDRMFNNRPFIETKDFIRMLNHVHPQSGILIKQMVKRAEEIEAQIA